MHPGSKTSRSNILKGKTIDLCNDGYNEKTLALPRYLAVLVTIDRPVAFQMANPVYLILHQAYLTNLYLIH